MRLSKIQWFGDLKMTAKRASMDRYRPKDPELHQLQADWFSDQRSQGKQMPSYLIHESSHGNQVDNQT